jgi:carbamate kinase
MGPKVEAACRFVSAGSGFAAIGSLGDAALMLCGEAGTVVATSDTALPWRPGAAAHEPVLDHSFG